MGDDAAGPITEMLLRWGSGESGCLGELMPLVEAELRRIAELRYFCGLSVEEVAEALSVHPNTVIRDWSLARAWLQCELSRGGTNAD